MTPAPLRIRWLGRVPYREAHSLQHGLFRHSRENYLLLMEHPPVYTLGVRATTEHVLVEPSALGGELVRVDRGGDITYHGPGQLVGYPIVAVPQTKAAIPTYVASIEDLVIDTLQSLGLRDVGRFEGYPGVWVDVERAPRKICAIGVRVSRNRSMHGFALNIDPDLSMFDRIVPCGIVGCQVTSLAAEGLAVSFDEVIDAVTARAARYLLKSDRVEVATSELQGATSATNIVSGVEHAPRPLERRLVAAGVDLARTVPLSTRKPSWLRVEANMGESYLALRKTMRSLDLVTVCEEAGCPNIYECWADGTATFMINGERCTRACGFCLVDTAHPLALDPDEPSRVAAAVAEMGLRHAVVTAVARDDLSDGGAAAFAATVQAIRERCPYTRIEVLIPDVKGDESALRMIFDARPDVLNHNLETVLRLQRAVRPSASYARSLAVLARAKAASLVTKSGLIVGLGEHDDEVLGALVDLAGVGVDIVTIGQYLRPSSRHLPVARYVDPDTFGYLEGAAKELGFSHVECSPLTRSSYHARQGAEAAATEAASA